MKINMKKNLFALMLCALVLAACEPEPKPVTVDVVDLGLSVKWATCNLGATTTNPAGDQYAWGETANKTDYTWETYKFYSVDETAGPQLAKYNTDATLGTPDNLLGLEAEDDVATQKLGADWRIPTIDDWDELASYCEWVWTTDENGVKGYKVTSLIDGYTENSIFLPATGSYYKNSLRQPEAGYYWSSTQGTAYNSGSTVYGYDSQAFYYYLSDVEYDWYMADRYYGRAIRPVQVPAP